MLKKLSGRKIRYFSTFSGIGAPEVAMQRLASQKFECVGYSEIDKYAVEIYQKHFNHKNYEDITKINAKKLPDFDLLIGGFPCQAFSIAGKRKGFEDTRGTLFFDLARIIKAKRPRLFLFENVKGLLSHDNGRTVKTILAAIADLGYDVQWQVINSKDHGVPQNRERIFFIGHLRGTRRPEVFPFGSNDGKINELQRPVTNTLIARYEGAQATGSYIGENKFYAQVGTLRTHKDGMGFRKSKSGLVPTIPARAREDGSGQPVIIARNQRNEVRSMEISGALTKDRSGKQLNVVAIPVLTPDRPNKRQNGRRFKEDGDPSSTITAQDRHGVMIRETEDGFHNFRNDTKKSSIQGTHVTYPKGKSHALNTAHIPMTLAAGGGAMQIRRLTSLECERLQGFPDGWTAGVSDAQRYKMLGNSMTVNVMEDIIRAIFDIHAY